MIPSRSPIGKEVVKMFVAKLEFIIRAERGNTIEEVLAMVESIKKVHPNAKIRVEVEV